MRYLSTKEENLKAVMRWIYAADYEELYQVVEEIRCVHESLYAWNPETNLFAKIESTCLNGETIQLNIEKSP